MTKTITSELTGSGSHYVSFTYSGELDKEEVYLTYATQWRGAAVSVSMSCDRYAYAGGTMSDWRVYAQRIRFAENDAPATDLARRRLSQQLNSLALEWLKSDDYRASEAEAMPLWHRLNSLALEWLKSDDYRASEAEAITRAITRALKDAYSGSSAARTLLARADIQRKLGASRVGVIERACSARDAYETALEAI